MFTCLKKSSTCIRINVRRVFGKCSNVYLKSQHVFEKKREKKNQKKTDKNGKEKHTQNEMNVASASQ